MSECKECEPLVVLPTTDLGGTDLCPVAQYDIYGNVTYLNYDIYGNLVEPAEPEIACKLDVALSCATEYHNRQKTVKVTNGYHFCDHKDDIYNSIVEKKPRRSLCETC